MFSIKNIQKLLHLQEESYEEFIEKIQKRFDDLHQRIPHFCNTTNFSMDVVKEELDLDEELINSLLDDYTRQLLRNIPQLKLMLAKIAKEKEKNFTPFKDLIHKNLGVARNLRIKNIEELLSAIMKSEDIDFIYIALDLVEACIILLKPHTAYEFIKEGK